MSIFVDANSTEIIEQGALYLRIEGSFYFGIGILFLWYGYFRAVQKGQISLLLTIVSLGTRVLLSYAFAHRSAFGVTIIWASIPIGWILADLAGLILYLKEGKKYDSTKRTAATSRAGVS
jgi:Na+-driven multidrug efflux pump